MPANQHQRQIVEHVRCAVITVSDTRTPETDESGRLIRDALAGAGHRVCSHEIIEDDPDALGRRLEALRDDPEVQAVLLTGGTGLAPRDATVETVVRRLDRRLDGFGELFRMLSYAEIGAAAMLSRAVAGVMGDTVVFAMPGSTCATRLAIEKLIIPELGHLVWLVTRA